MKYLAILLPAIFLLGCYSNPDDDYLNTKPTANNSVFIKDKGGASPMPSVPIAS